MRAREEAQFIGNISHCKKKKILKEKSHFVKGQQMNNNGLLDWDGSCCRGAPAGSDTRESSAKR